MTAGGLHALVANAPILTLAAGTQLHRIHAAEHGPWWFGDGTATGRFDPTGVDGLGACYLAEDPNAAWVEVFRSAKVLTTSELDAKRLSTIELGVDVTVVDLACAKAVTAGITGEELHGHHRYPQAIATEAVAHGYGGMRWRPRHDLGGQLVAVALFGPTGALQEHEEHRLLETVPLLGEVAEAACAMFGYAIIDAP